MDDKYRIVERTQPSGLLYILQTNARPLGYGAFNQHQFAQPEQKWYNVGTYATLEQARGAKRLFVDGLSENDKVVE